VAPVFSGKHCVARAPLAGSQLTGQCLRLRASVKF